MVESDKFIEHTLFPPSRCYPKGLRLSNVLEVLHLTFIKVLGAGRGNLTPTGEVVGNFNDLICESFELT